MPNAHANAVSGGTLVTTAETVLATLTAFNENEAGEFAEGVLIQGSTNLLIGTGGTAVVLRIRKASLTGALVGLAQTVTVAAASVVGLSIQEVDPVLIQPGLVYVLTASVTGASGNSTNNRSVIVAEGITAFE